MSSSFLLGWDGTTDFWVWCNEGLKPEEASVMMLALSASAAGCGFCEGWGRLCLGTVMRESWFCGERGGEEWRVRVGVKVCCCCCCCW
jgi:hypothetical protein